MSEFIRTLNLIKMHCSVEWLTRSQMRALTELKELLRVPGTVNLCGSAGVGKTFLAWVLANELGYVYFPNVKHFTQAREIAAPGVIIDNNQPNRKAHRDILKDLQFEDVPCAVLITRELIHDYTYYVELRLSLVDWKTVRQNLASIGRLSYEAEVSSLWYLVNPSLSIRL